MEFKKQLGALDVFSIAIGAMISSGIFILPGLAFAKTGPSVVLSYFIAGLLAMTSMVSTAELITAMPKTGGDFFFVSRSLGPALGMTSSLLSWYSTILKTSFTLIGISHFLLLVVDVNIHMTSVILCIVFIVINITGVKTVSRIQLTLVTIVILITLFYILTGIPKVKMGNFIHFAPFGLKGIIGTAGFVFISYGGLLKAVSLAEEIKNPGRNVPLGMFLALLVASIIYAMLIFVTIGVLATQKFADIKHLTPISNGAEVTLGMPGKIALSLAAVIAFFSTVNSGIISSSRYPIAMSNDRLLPGFLGKINSRFNTPHVSILLTGVLIIIFIFLSLEILVKTASTVLILTYIFPNISIIILREARLENYKPSFKDPFYPWLQIAGLAGLIGFIVMMGKISIMVVCIVMFAGLITYLLLADKSIKREYALQYLIDRIRKLPAERTMLENELKEILTKNAGK